ncbi:SubName: Full=Uncharacterized protein {ECO:0000313/EMBL:CCA71576.1} [Serendipita indica DSM 11827]|uniref:Stealth protein CR1 conserved region 1 domain-containing protein n=1 Tax=Serendipita indica (strain DSM 11827) TaxID=1109443 RepID=G4TJT3_SERID|nr:SubName: Full=Uncharacterized protein {ECO:0000313/EMBL:CCA71576.1} [Serendipita indica DSM 11827]CCA71576.1 hypothetical protein PIIN_05513 [Serendipita indica DSM 11827]
MSGDNYRLLRTDSNQEDDDDVDALEYGRPFSQTKASPSRIKPVVDAIWSSMRRLLESSPLYSPLKATTTSLRRDSSSSSSSTNSYSLSSAPLSIFQQLYFHSFDGKYATRRIYKRLLGSLGLGLVCLLLWLYWETVERIYYVQFIMNTPGPGCLVDRSTPDSYVQWSPDSHVLSSGQGPVYHCIRQRPQSKKSLAAGDQKGASLRTWRPLPADCIDAYYSAGASCSDGQRTTLDVVWTWVNGSDPMLIRSKARAKARLDRQRIREERQRQREHGAAVEYLPEQDDEEEELVIKEEENKHLYRDHDELRHSLRSVLENFRESANKFTILTSDFDFPTDSGEDAGEEEVDVPSARLGLLPQWLKFGVFVDESGQLQQQHQQTIGHWKDGDISLDVVHHAEVYDEYDGTVFNSNSIESQIGNVAGDKAFLYFNDDCFFNAPLSGSDFHSSNYGLVFRLVAYPWMLLTPHHYPVDSGLGEWHPMEFTNYLLSKRFGARRRPYPMHQVKVLQGALMREMWEMWSEQERINERHKFRGLGGLDKIGVSEGDEREPWMDELDPIELRADAEEEGAVDVEERKVRRRRRSIFQDEQGEDTETKPWRAPSIEEDEDDRPRAQYKGHNSDPHTNEYPTNDQSEGEEVDDGDAHVMFLFTHFVIERSREAMLWSYVVATLGDDDDAFGDAQRSRLREMLKSANATERVLESSGSTGDNVEAGRKAYDVVVERRKTMEPWRVEWTLREVGDKLKGSEYLFSSQDGDAYSYYDDKGGLPWWHDGSTDWPKLWHEANFDANITARPDWTRCTIEWDTCFDAEIHSASDMFKQVAFEKRECGDCLLKALVRASGDIGLSALLPPHNRTFVSQPLLQQPPQHQDGDAGVNDDASTAPPLKFGEEAIAPFLPLTTTWQEADFSLEGVFASGFWDPIDGSGRVRLREWTQRLMERYRYVLADTGNYFNVIGNPVDAERMFAYVDDHPHVPLVTINDVIWQYPELTDERMRTWFDQRWSVPAAWERPEGVAASSSSSMFDAFHWTKRMDEEEMMA